jgi:hypothetical protein
MARRGGLDAGIAAHRPPVPPLWMCNSASGMAVMRLLREHQVGMVSHVTQSSADHLQGAIEGTGAIVVGRRVYDYTNGWGGSHPLGVPLFLVTCSWMTRRSSRGHGSPTCASGSAARRSDQPDGVSGTTE